MALFETSEQVNVGNVSVDTSSTTIIAANANRRRLFLKNNDGTNPVYIKNDAVATTSHYMLGPGDSVLLENKSQWRGIATGAACVVSYLEEYD